MSGERMLSARKAREMVLTAIAPVSVLPLPPK